jgi:vitamin B12 transporter
MSYQFLDKRDSSLGYPPEVFVLDSYQLFNATAKYELIKNQLTLFGSATNILNANFVENIGYSTRGRNFRLGLSINL